MKRMNKGRIIIALITILFTFVFTGCNNINQINGTTNELKKSDAHEYIVKKTAVDTIKSIDVDVNIADVQIIPSDKFYVEIHYYYWENEPEYKIVDGSLTFDDTKVLPHSYSINFDMNNYVKIYLPKNTALDQLNVDSSSGNISIASFIANKLKIDSSYGNLTIKDASASKADVTLSSGSSEVRDFNIDSLKYTNSYGDADFININSEGSTQTTAKKDVNMDITMSSGKCTINNFSGDKLEVINSYGNITCKGLTVTDLNTKLSSGNLSVSESILDNADINNSYGDAILSLTGTEKDYKYNLSTSYGKIEVNKKSYEDHYTCENNSNKAITADLSSGNIKINFE